jgi:hypothetical protein
VGAVSIQGSQAVQETERWMRAIAAGLGSGGLVAEVNQTRGVLDITATLQRPGSKPAEVVIDEDGYVELRYWNRPGATPEQVTTVILRALATIAVAQRS